MKHKTDYTIRVWVFEVLLEYLQRKITCLTLFLTEVIKYEKKKSSRCECKLHLTC